MRHFPTHRARLTTLFSAAILLTTVAFAGPVNALIAEDPRPDARIVGGIEAAPGAWPSQAGLLIAEEPDLYQAQFCGGSVIAASWILTAAHCVDSTIPADIDVLTGQQDLAGTGGQRIDVVEIKRHPNWNPGTFQNDVALLRLDRPTNAPAMSVIQPGQSALWTAGTPATATGWGNTESTPQFPNKLRQVTVPIVSDASCTTAYPSTGAPVFSSASMVCAGVTTGGKDTCQGDSGGPLMVPKTGGGWVQMGITSWGEGCAEPNLPGVYTRLANFAPWVADQIKYGPFGSASSFVDRQYVDIIGRMPTVNERNTLAWPLIAGSMTPEAAITRLISDDRSFRKAGAINRLYYGFFERDPDTGGFNHWVTQHRNGLSLSTIASSFSRSAEFQNRYGALSNSAFVDLVYQHVLHRNPDAEGKAYWMNRLQNGLTRGSMMASVTESAEHRSVTRVRVERTLLHFAMLRTTPTSAWLDPNAGIPLNTLASTILLNRPYANRF